VNTGNRTRIILRSWPLRRNWLHRRQTLPAEQRRERLIRWKENWTYGCVVDEGGRGGWRQLWKTIAKRVGNLPIYYQHLFEGILWTKRFRELLTEGCLVSGLLLHPKDWKFLYRAWNQQEIRWDISLIECVTKNKKNSCLYQLKQFEIFIKLKIWRMH
jgi:hypothetical protein